MASKISQPTGFIKLTNVAFIKYKVDKQKFEIACYKNKALNWRNGVEKEMSEVLQSEEIYENATHGTIAKKDQLKKIFPNMEKIDIIKMILEKGELQVSDKEREAQTSLLSKDIINFIQERVVHPESQRQFSVEQITQAIQSIHFNIKSDQSTKRQALECIKQLQKKFNIQRAMMKISVTSPVNEVQKVQELIQKLEITDVNITQIESQESKLVFNIQPHLYRPVIDGLSGTRCQTEVMINNVVNKQVQDISNAGNVDFQVREDWVDDSNQSQSQQKTKKGSKKAQQQQKDQQQQQQQEEEDDGLEGKTKNKKQRQKLYKKQLKEQEEKERIEKENKLQQQLNQINNQHLSNNQQIDMTILSQQSSEIQEEQKVEEKPQIEAKPGQKKCTTCKEAFFDSASEYRTHFKSEWHVANVKRKTQSLSLYTYQEFQIAQLDQQFQDQ